MRTADEERRELADLRARVAELSDMVTALSAERRVAPRLEVRDPQDDAGSAVVGRRSMLGRLALVAAGGTGLALAGQAPAFAGTDGDVVKGGYNDSGSASTQLHSTSDIATLDISNSSPIQGAGISTSSNNDVALRASGGGDKPGIVAYGERSSAVVAQTNETSNSSPALVGRTGGRGNVVFGEQTYSSSTGAAVYALAHGFGNALYGEQANSTATSSATQGNGVLGLARGAGNSVMGWKPAGIAGTAVLGRADSGGTGVKGTSASGRGGIFESGTKAQVQLAPSTAATHPTNGQAGDLFVDKSKRLWFCKGTSNWVQIV